MSKNSNHPKPRTHPPTEAEKAEDLTGPEDTLVHGTNEVSSPDGPDPLEVQTNVVAIPTESGGSKPEAAPAVDPAHPFEPAYGNGKVRIRVRSTHGTIRAGHIDGQVVWFGPKETDHTVTPADLDTLRNDPILRIDNLVNGFTEAHRREANLNVERAQQALSEALSIRDRVNAGAPARNEVQTPNLYEGGELGSIMATDDMVRPEDVIPAYRPPPAEFRAGVEGRDDGEGVGTPRPIETTHDFGVGKPMPGTNRKGLG